jgi:hypothetical protein
LFVVFKIKGEVFMDRPNCWEFMRCGREPGGANAEELGICPASTYMPFHEIHGGTAAGRACWAVAGTMCRGKVSGTFAKKLGDCRKCEFYCLVIEQEGESILLTVDLLCRVDERVSNLHSGSCYLPDGRETERG